MPTYSVFEIYQHVKRIAHPEELEVLLDVLVDERRHYPLATFQCLRKLLESKKAYLEQLDKLEYRMVKEARRK